MDELLREKPAHAGYPSAEARRDQRELLDFTVRRWIVWEHRIPAADWTTADDQSAMAGYGFGWL
jgi:hypothetical protein